MADQRVSRWGGCLAVLAGVIAATPPLLLAQETSVVHAVRAAAPIRIDGRLDDAAWRSAPAADGFLQRDPNEGEPARAPTMFRVAYDADALYVGVRLIDPEPERITRRLSRRDSVPDADFFSLFLDPHHDHLTGVEFQVSAAGVQRDSIIYNDVYQDDNWNAVWASAVGQDEDGWVLEMRIPFSQLRFPEADAYVWGINASRHVQRTDESSWYVLVPKNESGLASRMAHLEGLEAVRPGRHLELLPYVTSRGEFIDGGDGNPFNDGTRAFAGAGLDVKYGLSGNLTLDATVNPDFGQVEVDPAVVNLSAFETFFEEKRPFFTEGSQIFSRFGESGASEYWSYFFPEPQLFYSRRIGRAPQGPGIGQHVDTPLATTLLGAAKLTGQTRDGWTVGLLDAVTGREYSRISDGLTRSEQEAEPLTNYFVGRAGHALGSRAALGVLATMVHRDLRAPRLDDLLVDQAYVVGTDGHVFLDRDHEWVISGGLAGSSLRGSQAATERLQRAPQRYYQRPDVGHVQLDTERTSLSGWTGNVNLNRNRGNVTVNAGLWGMSPGFDSNDLGFATQTDRAGGHGQVLFRKLTPDRFTRTRELVVAKWWTWNYDGDSQGDGVQGTLDLTFLNYWTSSTTVGWSRNTWDDKLTRGGPTTIRPGIRTLSTTVGSDARKRVRFSVTGSSQERNFESWSRTFSAELTLQPTDALSISAGPSYRRAQVRAQYLATVPDPLAVETFGARYVFGELAQSEWSMPTRLNVLLSPRLSVQLYLQPLISVGEYGDITEFARPRTYEFLRYGMDAGTIRPVAGDQFEIDPDGSAAAPSFRIPRPDFNVKSLRVNSVVRWEFRPGSTIYAVWTRTGEDFGRPGVFDFGSDFKNLWRVEPDDVLLVKMSWWIGR